MRLIAKILILAIATLLFSTTANGQKFRKKSKYMSVDLHVGTSNYVGELDPGSNFAATSAQFTRWNVGGFITKRMHPRITARAGLSYGRLQGSDLESATDPEDWEPYRRVRGLHFRNDFFEVKFDGVVDLFQNRKGLQKRVKLTPYGFLGVALMYHNPKAQFQGDWISLRNLGTEGQYLDGVGADGPYSRLQFVVPFGLGVRYKIGVLWDVAFEIGWRKTFTDYIDDVGGTYVDKANFAPGTAEYILSDPSIYLEDNPFKIYEENGHRYTRGYGKDGDQRGDKNADWYIITGFHVSYIFHPKLIAPKFKG